MYNKSGVVTDQSTAQVPIAGASVFVLDGNRDLIPLTDDDGNPIANPITTDAFGSYSYYSDSSGQFIHEYWWAARKRYIEQVVVGPLIAAVNPSPANAGQFIAYDASGNPTASSGTGADAGLRTDLAATTGSTLVKAADGNTVQDNLDHGGRFTPLGTGASARTTESAMNETVFITSFGAKFDVGTVDDIADATDDTDAWDAAIAHLSAIGGGTLRLPPGASKATREIVIDGSRIRIVGTGTRKVYPGVFTVGVDCPSTLVPVHTDRNAITFANTTTGGGTICCQDFNVATLETGDVPTAAFGWETGVAFQRNYSFDRVGIHGFTSAWDLYKSTGTNTQMGLFAAHKCVVNRNTWIARTLNSTQWNGFTFTNCEAGQNGYLTSQGGIAISANGVRITDCALEGMRDAVKISGGYQGVTIANNYFEANVGRACIELSSVIGPFSVGPNNFVSIVDANIGHKVLLTNCGLGVCVDPYWSSNVHKMDLPLIGNFDTTNKLNNTVSSDDYGYLRTDRMAGKNWCAPPISLATSRMRATSPVREINPQTARPMIAQEYSTTGTGGLSGTYTIAGSIGQWVVMSWMMKRVADGGAVVDPYITMSVNGSGDAGSRDYPVFNYSHNWRDGDWTVVTAAIKLAAAMTTIQVIVYPHGVSPAAGRISHFLRPYVYTVDDINKVTPFIDNWMAHSVTAAPTTGTWIAGDNFDLSAPADGATRTICTLAGTPGTWVSN